MFLRYLEITKVQKGAYFGRVHAAQQINPSRTIFMRNLLSQEARQRENGDEYNIVEIGSWAGESAILWAEQLKKMNLNGKIICIDSWSLYDEINDRPHPKGSTRQRMKRAIEKDAIFKLFLHNINASGHGDIVRYFRGSSDELLPFLRENYFDLVYIDGNHRYTYVRRDIENAMRITRDGGVICGDDLEMQKSELDQSIDLDKIRLSSDDPIEYRTVEAHLGITVAVGDAFQKEVSSWNGFWAMRKVKNHYEKVTLNFVEESIMTS